MFLLPRRIVISGYNAWRFDSWRWFRHNAIDYKAYYEPITMPFDGNVNFRGANNKATQGGLWIDIENDLVKIETAHNSRVLKTGFVKKGYPVGITGNSGYLTSGPHSHLQMIFKPTGKRFNPELYHWGLQQLRDHKTMFVRQSEVGKDFFGEVSFIDASGTRHAFPTEDSLKEFGGIDNSNIEVVVAEIPYRQYTRYPKGKDFPT